MPPEVGPLAALCCPLDHGPLCAEGDALRCETCGAHFPIRAGIPDFTGNAPSRSPRWMRAQAYELDYWTRRGGRTLSGDRAHFVAAAAGLAEIFDGHSGPTWRERVVHIGPAGLGEIHHLPARERFAVEPLAIALDRRGLLDREGVHWLAAMGEHLPFFDHSLSAAVVPNVIDHVADPARLLDELHRCLRPGAPLWLTSHVGRPGVASLMGWLARTRLGYFAGHPHAFTPAALRKGLVDAGFRIVREEAGPAVDDASDRRLRARVKGALLGVRYLLAVA